MQSPRFNIETKNNIIYVGLQGTWTVQQDLLYLTRLTEVVAHYRGRSWGVFVDMNDWHLPQEVFNSPFKSKIALSRKNQMAEAWLVNKPDQGNELMPFFRKVKFEILRTTTLEPIKQHFLEQNLHFDIEVAKNITNWQA